MTRDQLLGYIKDRPCEVCKFHKDTNMRGLYTCTRWKCAFEEKLTDEEPCDGSIYDRLLDMSSDIKDLIKQLEDRGLDEQLFGAIKVINIISKNIGEGFDEHRPGNE